MRTFRKQQQGGSQATSSAASTSEGVLSPSAGLSPASAGAPPLHSSQPAIPSGHSLAATGPENGLLPSGHPPGGYLLESSGPSGGSPTPRSSLTAALKGSSPVQHPTPTFQVQAATEHEVAGSSAVAPPGTTTVGFSVEAPGFVPAAQKAQQTLGSEPGGTSQSTAASTQVCASSSTFSAYPGT